MKNLDHFIISVSDFIEENKTSNKTEYQLIEEYSKLVERFVQCKTSIILYKTELSVLENDLHKAFNRYHAKYIEDKIDLYKKLVYGEECKFEMLVGRKPEYKD